MSATATIAEIAARAGVGTATVDRVLNKRAGRQRSRRCSACCRWWPRLGAPPQPGRPRRDANAPLRVVLPADDFPVPRNWSKDRLRRPPATSAMPTSPRSRTASTAPTPGASRRTRAGRRLRGHRPDGARPASDQARHQRAGARRRARGDACSPTSPARCARPACRRRQPGRRPHRRPAAGADGQRQPARHACCSPRRRPGCRPRSSGASASPTSSRSDSPGCTWCARPTCRRTTTAPARVAAALLQTASTRRASPASTTSARAAPALARALAEAGLAVLVGMAAHDLTDQQRLAAEQPAPCPIVLHAGHPLLRLDAARVLRALCENVRGALNVVQPRMEILTAENLH